MKKAQAAIEAAKKASEDLLKVAAEKYQAAKLAKGDDKSKAEEALKAAEADAKGAEKKVEDLSKTITKLSTVSDKAAKLAAEKSASLATARKNAKANASNKGKTAVSPKDVKKAASAEGSGANPVKLNATEMRRYIEDLTKPGSFPKVRDMALAIKAGFDGVATYNQMYAQLGTITGERKGKKSE